MHNTQSYGMSVYWHVYGFIQAFVKKLYTDIYGRCIHAYTRELYIHAYMKELYTHVYIKQVYTHCYGTEEQTTHANLPTHTSLTEMESTEMLK